MNLDYLGGSQSLGDFPGGSVIKSLPVRQEAQIQSLSREDTLEKEMATHSSILAWRIPWTEEHGGLQSLGLQRCGRRDDKCGQDFMFRMQGPRARTRERLPGGQGEPSQQPQGNKTSVLQGTGFC